MKEKSVFVDRKTSLWLLDANSLDSRLLLSQSKEKSLPIPVLKSLMACVGHGHVLSMYLCVHEIFKSLQSLPCPLVCRLLLPWGEGEDRIENVMIIVILAARLFFIVIT